MAGPERDLADHKQEQQQFHTPPDRFDHGLLNQMGDAGKPQMTTEDLNKNVEFLGGKASSASDPRFPELLGALAESSVNRNLGPAGERNSARGASEMIAAAGADIAPVKSVEELKTQLDGKGWVGHEYKPGDKLPPGAVILTENGVGKDNVGIVSNDGKVISHSGRQGGMASMAADKWSPAFTKYYTPPTDK